MVGTWGIEKVRNYLRKVALEAGHRLSERDVFVFTDHPPRWDDWTEEDLMLLNRMLRALYNSPASFKVFEMIVATYLLVSTLFCGMRAGGLTCGPPDRGVARGDERRTEGEEVPPSHRHLLRLAVVGRAGGGRVEGGS